MADRLYAAEARAYHCSRWLRRERFGWAALLAVCAAWTREVGAALVVQSLIAWVRHGDWMELDLEWRQVWVRGVPWRAVGRAALAFAPVLAFLA